MADRNLSLMLRLMADSSGFVRGLNQGKREVAQFTGSSRREFEQLSKARELLGVRPERSIQRELQRTEAAYARLKRSGTLTWREQVSAADAMRRKVAQLNEEMGKLSRWQKVTGVMGGAAGAAVAINTMRPRVEKAMSYDLKLSHMSNTAFADRNLAGRKEGVKELNSAIVDAVRKGGGSRDSAASALDFLIASGAVNVGDAKSMLPTVMKNSTATAADPNDLAAIAVRAVQNMKVKPEDLGKVFDYSIAGGQGGGFEIKDMAKWLPQQMAIGAQLGLTGPEGVAKLVALNQASVITAGTKDEAGNNLVNLLAKINSSDTANNAKKLGINLPEYLAKNRAQGVDAVDAFVGLADQTVSKQQAWKQLQAKLKTAKDGSEERDTLEAMASIVQGSAIGQIIQDRQALMPLVAMMNNREYFTTVQGKTLNGVGAGQANFDLISTSTSFQAERAANEGLIAQQNLFEGLAPAINETAGGLADLAQKFPELATATVAATAALTALAAAGAGAALGGALPAVTGAAGGAIGGAAAGAGRALWGGAKGVARGVGGFALRRALPLWGAWETGQFIGGQINQGLNWGVEKVTGKEGNTLGGAMHDFFKGEIRVRVDQTGTMTSVTAKSDTKGVSMAVDSGRTMFGP